MTKYSEDHLTYPVTGNGDTVKVNKYKQQIKDIKGKTLEVYYYLVKNPGYHGVREIQRSLEYSSPTLASYHLNILIDKEIIVKNEKGQYSLISDNIRLGLLEEHLKIVSFWVPRSAILAMITFLLGVTGIIFLILELNQYVWAFVFIPSLFTLTFILLRDGIKMNAKLVDRS
ncbi:MAG: hypothetical protein ACXAD7_19630 [Candidatus Kariarchaeaceae archaeon]|jgi:hypothetical protein